MDRMPIPPVVPARHVTTPFAEARVIFAQFDANADTSVVGISGEYVAISRAQDGTASVTDYGDVFRAIGRSAGDASSVSIRQYQQFVERFDRDANGVLDPVEFAAYSAFLAKHSSSTFGATR